MITINSGKLTIPEKERFIGFAGDNLHSKKQFLVENITDENCIYRLYLKFDDGAVNYFVLDSKVENGSTILTWNILEEHIFKSGIVNAQVKSISDSGETYHTSWDYFFVAPSAEFSEEFKNNENAEFLRYEKELNEIYNKINETDLSSFVTKDRTIAGLSLSCNIMEKELYQALSIYPTIIKDGPPTVFDGPTQSYLIDTLNGDLYYCDRRTLSGNNWIKLTGGADSDYGVPEYWDEHLSEKISAINNLQLEGGKDCFSFIVMTDIHYPSNLGKISPLIAKRIIDECNIKYALCLGDTQTRGCHATKEALLTENKQIKEMFKPLNGHLLLTEGNHDGSYGLLDRDGDGTYSNIDSDGNIKAPALRETYVNNLTPAELHNAIYRNSGTISNVCFDESGTGYYVDDTANKVRYLVLNTHNNEYKLQADGTSLYPKMWLFRFGQLQFDFVVDALNNIPADSWGVVVAGHCPLWQEIGDRKVMQGVLNAYKTKTTYSGEYVGTALGGAAYANHAQPLPDNTTDTTMWVNGYRISSSNVSAQSGKTVSNTVSVKVGDVVRVKGVDFVVSEDRYQLSGKNSNGEDFNNRNYVSVLPNTVINYELVDDVHTFTVVYDILASDGELRFAFTTPEDASRVIITINEEITETEHGYDYVKVDADFTSAKGDLVGYFAGHNHVDNSSSVGNIVCVTTRCDGKEENDVTLKAERVAGTTTEQSFDVITVNKAEKKIYATKIGAGDDRVINY